LIIMKKKIYLAMLAVCFALTASACGDGGAVITDGTKTEGAADGKKAETGTTRLVSVENVEKYITIGEYKGLWTIRWMRSLTMMYRRRSMRI